MKIAVLFTGLLLLGSMMACNDSSTIGSSIVQDEIEVVVDSSFTVTGSSQYNTAIQSRTLSQLIGEIDASGYGFLKSDVVTQFMPASSMDTTGISVNDIDSLKLIMQVNMGEYVGDSITPMGLNIYRLNRQLPSPIYSDFDPSGYYSKDDLLSSVIYNVSAISETDSVKRLKYRSIYVDMPIELGRQLYSKYRETPELFSSPTAFAEFFPGIYMENSYGSGRVTRVASTTMRLYYHRTWYDETKQKDTTAYKTGNYFAVTPEIVTNNNITLNVSQNIKDMVAQGDNVILAPAGFDLQLTFPARDIISRYNATKGDLSVINSLTFSIPAEAIENGYKITVPPYLLLVLSTKKDEFFQNGTLPDGKTSFYAAYDSTTGAYQFTDMRNYILDLLAKDQITDEDITFTLTPVLAEYETSGSSYYYGSQRVLSGITPYVATPVMAKISLDKAKIKFTYSKQTVIF